MNAWPTTEEVRAKYSRGMRSDGTPAIFEKWGNEFDRWLADHDAKVRAEALRSALRDFGDWADELVLTVGDEHDESTWVDVTLREWIERRVARIERGEQA